MSETARTFPFPIPVWRLERIRAALRIRSLPPLPPCAEEPLLDLDLGDGQKLTLALAFERKSALLRWRLLSPSGTPAMLETRELPDDIALDFGALHLNLHLELTDEEELKPDFSDDFMLLPLKLARYRKAKQALDGSGTARVTLTSLYRYMLKNFKLYTLWLCPCRNPGEGNCLLHVLEENGQARIQVRTELPESFVIDFGGFTLELMVYLDF